MEFFNIQQMIQAGSEPTECVEGKEHDFVHVIHLDGRDTYSNIFQCSHCEQYVKKTFQRSKESLVYWD